MKSIWRGSLTFGLVNIPVQLYSAIKEHRINFRLLCNKCHTPITYKDWCQTCRTYVAWKDIVKGLKLSNGRYFIITKQKLRELRPQKTETIAIKEFVDRALISWIYLENHYYITPERTSAKAYFLFKKALEETNMTGIGQFVMHEKEHICALSPYDNGILLSTLNYPYEIREFAHKASPETRAKFTKEELQLAEQLITQSTKKKLNLSQYKDTFIEKLTHAIKKSKGHKIPGQKIKEQRIPKAKKSEEPSLAAILKRSIRKPTRTQQPVARARKRSRA